MAYLTRFVNSSVFLISVSLLLIYLLLITPIVFSSCCGVFDGVTYGSIIFLLGYTVLCCLILPLSICILLFKEKLSEIGLRWPQNKLMTIFVTFISLVILVPIMFALSKTQGFQHYYSLQHISLAKLLFIILFFMPLYYFAEEFFFRGFIFLHLWRKIKWHGFWLTELLFMIAHIAKPDLEIYFSFIAGMFLNYVTLKTKSNYPAMVVHYVLGVANFLSINFHVIAWS